MDIVKKMRLGGKKAFAATGAYVCLYERKE